MSAPLTPAQRRAVAAGFSRGVGAYSGRTVWRDASAGRWIFASEVANGWVWWSDAERKDMPAPDEDAALTAYCDHIGAPAAPVERTPLSPEAQAARRPLPPEVLAAPDEPVAVAAPVEGRPARVAPVEAAPEVERCPYGMLACGGPSECGICPTPAELAAHPPCKVCGWNGGDAAATEHTLSASSTRGCPGPELARLRAEVAAEKARADKAEATIARARALPAGWEARAAVAKYAMIGSTLEDAAADLRAALDGTP